MDITYTPQGERSYERPEAWEQQVEWLHDRCLKAGIEMLTDSMSETQARNILGAIAVRLFFGGVRVVDPWRH
jgi:hypothetical protein